MTKEDITKAVHKSADHILKANLESSVSEFNKAINGILLPRGIQLTSEEVLNLFMLLFRGTVEASAFTTIHTLFDLGLLNQENPE